MTADFHHSRDKSVCHVEVSFRSSIQLLAIQQLCRASTIYIECLPEWPISDFNDQHASCHTLTSGSIFIHLQHLASTWMLPIIFKHLFSSNKQYFYHNFTVRSILGLSCILYCSLCPSIAFSKTVPFSHRVAWPSSSEKSSPVRFLANSVCSVLSTPATPSYSA